jgi:CheY-like chemotaxis protein
LERILRNLVSNAVRYTDRGKILVGCRRRGRYLSLQVWDTGRGIAVGEQDRVFQEFYQAGTSEPHRDKGLGLGLAIVKRLAILLDHPLELSSELGRGTAFKLLLPATCQEATSTPATLSLAPCFAPSALILVIEDAFTAREAMRDLLTSWGYDVIVAASRADMLARITQCPSPPDLILCGYRLQGETMGVDLIRSLHAEYNEDIPAALIIDDATSDGVQAAREARIAVLSKPIANSKLRAMIGNLMNKPRASDQAEYAA